MTLNGVIAHCRHIISSNCVSLVPTPTTTCSRIKLIDQKSASITRRTVKLVCVTKFTHSQVYTTVPVHRFTLQLLTYRLIYRLSFTLQCFDA